jgi:mannosylglycoprotein endo-beta-mannosidase
LGIGPEEWAFRYHLEGQMMSLFRQEEEYWRQKGRVCWSTLGDANTAYFHAVANGRRRKCNISSLNTSGGVIMDKRLIHEHVYDFYRELLGSSEPRSCSLAAFAWEESERVSGAENEDLMRTLTEQELDGFPVWFFKKNWGLIKQGILHILNDFILGRIDVARLNFEVLSLILEVPGADQITLLDQ